MSEYIPDTGVMPNVPVNIDTNEKGGHNRYGNVILTLILISLIIVSIISIVMISRISKTVENTDNQLKGLAKDVSYMEDSLNHVSGTVEDILEQGCTGSSSSYEPEPYEPEPYDPDPYMMEDKPVIYLYGAEDGTKAHVELKLTDADMSVTWPEADENNKTYSWDVSADADGTIRDADGNEYSYLFWEARSYAEPSFDKGFCVAGSDTADFLKNSLSAMGLSSKEYNEFITYWLPRMQGNAYNLISFSGMDVADEYNENHKLSVSDEEGRPADSMLRVFMTWKAVEAPVDIEAQEFGGFEREGFTVVEWGGTEVK